MDHTIRRTAIKIARRLDLVTGLVYRRRQDLPPFRLTLLKGPLDEPPVDPGVDDGRWPIVEPNTYWGQWESSFVLRTRFRVPDGWGSDRPTALLLQLGEAGDFSHPEALVYIDGTPYAACDRHHQEVALRPAWRDGQDHHLALHGWTGLGGWQRELPGTRLYILPSSVVQIDQPTRDFVAAARVALNTATSLREEDPARHRLLDALDRAFRALDIREPLGEPFYDSVPAAHELLLAAIAAAGPPLDVDILATGHAHIDVAWLWTLGQTRRKAGRTFHTVLRLMEQFHEFHFAQSQAQLYDFVLQDYPALFQAIRERVTEGRWEPVGGTWVEMDCNITGPESLVRQFLLGTAFFRQHLSAAQSRVLWLPDVFGFSACLPQLIKQAGMDYFFTIKLGWNQYNRMPYDSFWWQGIDGTRVLTHFSTTPWTGAWFDNAAVSTYNAEATPQEALGTWNNLKNKGSQAEMLMAFGHGDGGGGPTREMLENIREMRAFPGLPRMRQGSVQGFFQRLEADSGERLPTWNGELYFELHRGTYTTQSRSKRANRKSEFLLHDAEFLITFAMLLDSRLRTPLPALREAWELVCLNQFHDIIPGSSIGAVYDESLRQYDRVRALGTDVCNSALGTIAERVGGDLLLVNPTSFSRQDLAFWPGAPPAGAHLCLTDGTPVPAQAAAGGTWLAAGELAPYSATPLYFAAGRPPEFKTGLRATPTLLENRFIRVELNPAGDITRIYDLARGRDVLAPGSVANQFQAFEDRPLEWDAWDIDIFYDDKMWTAEPATAVQIMESDPLRASLEIRRRILNSDIVQRISLAHNGPQLDFETTVLWCERHVLLKAAFPVDILSPLATHEIQWGHIQRPTHRNTSWDWARFESCAQKWVDLSEGGYGVSLLNDCKYGHDIHDNVIRITLLRSPTMPDPEADQGAHQFTYSLLPHDGPWDERTIAAAYALNDAILVTACDEGKRRPTAAAPAGLSLIRSDRPNVVIETVKPAEDGDGIVVRLYESRRHRGLVRLTTGFPLAQAWRTNLLEVNETKLAVDGNQIDLMIKPFEIVTLRLVPAR